MNKYFSLRSLSCASHPALSVLSLAYHFISLISSFAYQFTALSFVLYHLSLHRIVLYGACLYISVYIIHSFSFASSPTYHIVLIFLNNMHICCVTLHIVPCFSFLSIYSFNIFSYYFPDYFPEQNKPG